jgi:hypothetical protein
VEGSYTGAVNSRLNKGTHRSTFDAALSDKDEDGGNDDGREAGDQPQGVGQGRPVRLSSLLSLTGNGRDEGGSFLVEGTLRREGNRVAFAKLYSNTHNTVVLYKGRVSQRTFCGEWRVLDDKECGTAEFTFSRPEGTSHNGGIGCGDEGPPRKRTPSTGSSSSSTAMDKRTK